jgi:O-antigen ligase
MLINIATALAMIIIFAKTISFRGIAILSLILITVFVIFILLPTVDWQGRLDEPITPADDPRMQLMQTGLLAWEESPIIGTGLGTYSRYAAVIGRAIFSNFGIAQYEEFSSHNTYITFLVETGAIGLLGLIGFLFSLIGLVSYQFKWSSINTYSSAFQEITPILLSQILIFWFFGETFNMNAMWFLIGLILVGYKLSKVKLGDKNRQERHLHTEVTPLSD